ncbi:MAG: hypothetical protein AAF636_15380 [Pseudomonadota bacterium]
MTAFTKTWRHVQTANSEWNPSANCYPMSAPLRPRDALVVGLLSCAPVFGLTWTACRIGVDAPGKMAHLAKSLEGVSSSTLTSQVNRGIAKTAGGFVDLVNPFDAQA